MNASTNIKGLVNDIRRRWRRRALLQGGALVLLVLLGCATVLLLLYTTVPIQPVHLLIGLVVAGLLVLGVLVQYLARPLFKRLSDQQIALYVEEKIPGLEDRLNSAVEVDSTAQLREDHSGLVDRLIDDAVRQTRAVPLTTVIDQKRERLLGYSAIVFLVVFLIYGYTVFDKINVSDSNITLASLTTPVSPFMMVEPGNAEIEKGASQEILVTLRDEPDRDVILVYKEGDGEWQKEPMRKGLDEPAFLQEFHSIQEPIQYYVEVGERKSDPYTITLYEFPEVAQIDVTYRFPEYTALPARVEEDMGDIRGLKGSTVILNVQTTGSVDTAEMVLDDGRTIALNAAGDGRFRGSLALQEEGFYTLRLTDAAEKNNKFPTEYQIVPVEDEKPYITITDPQNDVRVNALEEVLLAATVQDDYGVKDMRLAFSVNGAEEQTLRLMKDTTTTATEVMGEHLFFLEDYSLQPGDVISYYVQAEDYFHADAPESTDMYFIEVIPFDQKFRQAANMQGQGGQPSGLVLSQQQIIAATWKLHRERDEMDETDVNESIKGLVQAQQNLKASIEERINSTAFSRELQGNETNRQIVEHLRDAILEMDKAVVELTADELKKALTPERRALTSLLRADALNKEQQVAQNQGGQGGQGGATEERMTELMDLELDISKDKYETQQQASQQGQQNKQMDEALERIRELARKQQNLANQNQQQENLQGEDKKRFIDKLKRDQDELRRETERLANNMQQQSRQQGQQMSREAQEQLDRVAENMREAEQALRRGDEQQARTRQQQALNELQKLQREMQMASNNTSREQVEDLAEQFDEVREQEQQLARDLAEAERDARARGGEADQQTLDRLSEKREQVRENFDQLLEQADAVQRRIRQEDPNLSTAIRNMVQEAKRERIEENMRDSEKAIDQGWLDYAQRLEEQIQRTMEKLETQRRAFDQALPVTQEDQLARSLEDVRDLARQLEQMQNRSEQQAQQGQGQQQEEGQQPGQDQGQNPDRAARADAARSQRQLDQARETLDRLQRDLGGNPEARSQIRQLQSNLNRADNTGVLLKGEAAKAFFNERIFDPLAQLEMEIARQLDLVALEKKLYGSRNADIPAEYRALVEKYYEALSKGGGR